MTTTTLTYIKNKDIASLTMNDWKMTAKNGRDENGQPVVELHQIIEWQKDDEIMQHTHISYALQESPLEWLEYWAGVLGKEIEVRLSLN